MADELSPIQQKIELILEEQLKNANAVVNQLKSINKEATKVSKSLQKTEEAMDKTSKSANTYKKALYMVVGAFKQLYKILKVFIVAVGSAGIALSKFYSSLLKSNDGFRQMSIAISDSSSRFADMKRAMESFTDSTGNMNVALLEAAEAVGAFAQKDIASRRVLANTQKLGENILRLTSRMRAAGMSADEVQKMTEGFSDLEAGQMEELFGPKSQQGGTAWVMLLREMNPEMVNLYDQLTKSTDKFKELSAAFAAGDLDKPGREVDKMAFGLMKWHELTGQLSSVWKKFSTDLFIALNSEIMPLLKDIGENWVPKLREALGEVISFVKSAMPVVVAILKTWFAAIKGLLAIFQMMPGPIKVVIALMLMPGVGSAIVAVGKVVWGLAKAWWAVRAAKAAASFVGPLQPGMSAPVKLFSTFWSPNPCCFLVC